SKVDGDNIFAQILSDLKNPVVAYRKLNGRKLNLKCPGYRIYSLVKKDRGLDFMGNPIFKPEDYIIKAEHFGIPQARHRIILLGIRNDIVNIPVPTLKARDHVPLSAILKGLPR